MAEEVKEIGTINVEPEWNVLFNRAIEIVHSRMDEAQGRDFVIEMLEYGQRLRKQKENNFCSDPWHINPNMRYVYQDPLLT